jgi:hypothetical protein
LGSVERATLTKISSGPIRPSACRLVGFAP